MGNLDIKKKWGLRLILLDVASEPAETVWSIRKATKDIEFHCAKFQ